MFALYIALLILVALAILAATVGPVAWLLARMLGPRWPQGMGTTRSTALLSLTVPAVLGLSVLVPVLVSGSFGPYPVLAAGLASCVWAVFLLLLASSV